MALSAIHLAIRFALLRSSFKKGDLQSTHRRHIEFVAAGGFVMPAGSDCLKARKEAHAIGAMNV
jgi:hypothetical protein